VSAVPAPIATLPKCEECRELWLSDDHERWQAFWIDDGPDEKLVFYCAECAEFEFGEFVRRRHRRGGSRLDDVLDRLFNP
jgi:hypothetical protein